MEPIKVKSGWQTTEFYTTLVAVVGMIAVGLEAMSKTAFAQTHPAIGAIIAVASIVAMAIKGGMYDISRAMVKSANAQANATLGTTVKPAAAVEELPVDQPLSETIVDIDQLAAA